MEALADLALGMLVARHPCARCTFALATHAEKDVVFGVTEPVLCADCIACEDHVEDWVQVPDESYGALSLAVLKHLRWLDSVTGQKPRRVWTRCADGT